MKVLDTISVSQRATALIKDLRKDLGTYTPVSNWYGGGETPGSTVGGNLRNAQSVGKATSSAESSIARVLPQLLATVGKYVPMSKNVAVAVLATAAVESNFELKPEALKNPNKYEGRKDLGNIYPGDGYKYRGRGLIQITGRHNYTYYGNALGYDLVNNPDMALRPDVAAEIFGLYFRDRKLKASAEAGDWVAVRQKVNGGLNGWDKFKSYVDKLMLMTW